MNSELELAKLALRLKNLMAESGADVQVEIEALQEQLTAFGERLRKLERRPVGGGGGTAAPTKPTNSWMPGGW